MESEIRCILLCVVKLNPSILSHYKMIKTKLSIHSLIIIACVIFSLYYQQIQTIESAKHESKPFGIIANGKPSNDTSKWENNEEIQILREYLRIPSVHPNIDYEPCVEFLKKQTESLDLPISIHYPVNAKNPVVVITWPGLHAESPSIMLNSHMDVVPVYEEF